MKDLIRDIEDNACYIAAGILLGGIIIYLAIGFSEAALSMLLFNVVLGIIGFYRLFVGEEIMKKWPTGKGLVRCPKCNTVIRAERIKTRTKIHCTNGCEFDGLEYPAWVESRAKQ